MKLLFIKLGIFTVLCLSVLSFVLLNFGGNVDYFYEKFTTPKAKSMIIGDSRSLQGIQPSVMNSYFENKNYDLPVFNYSFTIAQALIGPLYNESVLKKLDNASRNGVFVISVTPEMITAKEGFDNTKGQFREEGQPPHNMDFVSVNPNFEYVIKNYSFFHFKSVFRKNSTLHKDGWLEENNLPKDEEVFKSWKKNQINLFLHDRKEYAISDVRINSLHILIDSLKKHGSVYLVRMPISKEFLGYEQQYFPHFNDIMDEVSIKNDVPYFDFNKLDREYTTYDGHHLDKYSGKEFTLELCRLIDKTL